MFRTECYMQFFFIFILIVGFHPMVINLTCIITIDLLNYVDVTVDQKF